MQKIGVLYNPIKEAAKSKVESLATLLEQDGFKVWTGKTARDFDKWDPIENDSDLVVVFGGDGTFLAAARHLTPLNIPVLGINYGHLGFLAEYGDLSAEELLKFIKEKNFTIEERSMLEASIEGQSNTFNALNDIVIHRIPQANLLYTDLYIDNNLLHSFRADGIVICTPTGSTAYALSAGGSVMDPNIRAFQIVPIASHSFTSRPHVVSDNQTIVLESKDEGEFTLQADGQELIKLNPKTKITVKKSSYSLKLVKLNRPNRSFYNILRDKMKWGSISN